MSFFIRRSKHKLGEPPGLPKKLSDRAVPADHVKNNKRRKPGGEVKMVKGDGRSSNNRRGRHTATFSKREGEAKKRRKVDHDDDEITSEEDDDDDQGKEGDRRLSDHHDSGHDDDDDDDGETVQEARVRMAKQEIAALKKRMEEEEEDREVDDEALGARLKENVLVEEGRVLRRGVADKFCEKVQVEAGLCYSGGKLLKSPITSMVVDPSGSVIFASTKSGVVLRYSVPDGDKTHVTLKPPPVSSLAISGSVLAASTPAAIHLLSSATLEILHKFNSREAGTLATCGDTLFSAHKDRTIKLWNVKERAYVEALFGHQDVPTSLDTVTVGGGQVRCVSAGGFDRTLRVWKISEESQLLYNWDEDIIDCVRVVSSVMFVAASCSGSIGLFSFNRKKPLSFVKEAHGVDPVSSVPRWVTSLAVCRGSDLVLSGSDSGVVIVWRIGQMGKSLEQLRAVGVGDGVVVAMHICCGGGGGEDSSTELKAFVAVSTETRNGRWSGRVGKKPRLLVIE